MICEPIEFSGCYLIKPKLYFDNRGYFYESFNEEKFRNLIKPENSFIQDNQSFSKYGVLRGLHYQSGEHAQAKLVNVVVGSVLDVVLDLRENSKTYGEFFSIELNDKNMFQLYIPRGMAHGFVVLSEYAIFQYKVDNNYDQNSESGVIYNDPSLKIDWKVPETDLIISDKDLELPRL